MAFKMKAGKEGPMKKNFGISPMKNYKKGYYGEGSSMKYRPPSHGTGMRPLTGEDKAKLEEMTGEIKMMKAVRKKLVPTSRYTESTSFTSYWLGVPGAPQSLGGPLGPPK